MFEAKVYKIAVVSLSGIMEEVYAAKEEIRKWNEEKAEKMGKVFVPVEQPASLNNLQNVDVVMGVVDNRIENTAFIDECMKADKTFFLFFNEFADPKNTIASEQQVVKDYRMINEDRCFCTDYNGVPEFRRLLNEKLELI